MTKAEVFHPAQARSYREFRRLAQENIVAYGDVVYELGKLVAAATIDEVTGALEYMRRPEYLDFGGYVAAFTVRAPNQSNADVLTAQYLPAIAVDSKLKLFAEQKRQQHDERVEALWRARSIKRHVQLQAEDRDHGLIITSKAKGKKLVRPVELTDRVEPTQTHWKELRQTANALRRAKLGFDGGGSNFTFDPESGFTLFDTHLRARSRSRELSTRQIVQRIQREVEGYNDLSEWI